MHPLQEILNDSRLVLCDVGASYFLPDTWQLLTQLKSSTFVLIDPNQSNLDYAKSYTEPKIIKVAHALSGNQGPRIFHHANTDSGSSLYPPVNREWERDQEEDPYFYPMRLLEIETITLAQVFDQSDLSYLDCIKLDTQGSELEILLGLDESRWKNLLFIEAEVNLQNPSPQLGGASLPEVMSELEKRGFSLANIRTSRVKATTTSGISLPNECDVLFVREPHRLVDYADCNAMARRSIVLALSYYLHDFARLFLNAKWGDDFGFSSSEVTRFEQIIEQVALAQEQYLKQGGLSLWHRDG